MLASLPDDVVIALMRHHADAQSVARWAVASRRCAALARRAADAVQATRDAFERVRRRDARMSRPRTLLRAALSWRQRHPTGGSLELDLEASSARGERRFRFNASLDEAPDESSVYGYVALAPDLMSVDDAKRLLRRRGVVAPSAGVESPIRAMLSTLTPANEHDVDERTRDVLDDGDYYLYGAVRVDAADDTPWSALRIAVSAAGEPSGVGYGAAAGRQRNHAVLFCRAGRATGAVSWMLAAPRLRRRYRFKVSFDDARAATDALGDDAVVRVRQVMTIGGDDQRPVSLARLACALLRHLRRRAKEPPVRDATLHQHAERLRRRHARHIGQ